MAGIRGGYIASWAQYRPGRGRFTPEDYKPGLCTHLFYAFAGFGDDYIVKSEILFFSFALLDFSRKHLILQAQDPSDAVPGTGGFALVNSLKNRDPGLKTLISIGGWSFGKEKFKVCHSLVVPH
ncbi:unnamed protein product [Anisakis simplex]|uniref:Glyco_hydro_18 domain-containing protein n=1 Tax=Anisakis simplex TaxID=6269 RepID=A0A0M3J4R2_ANISI|nr:unnamed protein product [Anisakis simplex]